ncbi:Rossmann fold domain-containing protein [Erythrobacter litoralis]|uniref:Short chain dehydrogenase-like proteobacteria domain-containing protein n=1 Tax=Erythrobacter litoralis (strain HTCC2594) TaxID=314225 RepID=Q2NCE4_ERYLH|nr:hypothetical protein [Erythrobacter litoralis]ABC62647.1 hypothetical protein ELI_02775 [Erythrobacter litoralis HTCC2594]
MAQAVLRVDSLPASAVEAANTFHTEYLPQAVDLLEGDADNLVIVMPAAFYDHADWRRALARDLARAHTPIRVNVIGSDDPDAVTAALAYCDKARGVTGHYLPLNSLGAGDPLASSG